jgi:endonuclease-8
VPEGDTVHKLASALSGELCGERLTDVRIRGLDPKPLRDAEVLGVWSRGKHLFIELNNGLALRSHLGLYGSWHSYAPGEAWRKPRRQAWISLGTETRRFVCFNAREVEILASAGFRLTDAVRRLGPDLTLAPVDIRQIEGRARELAAPETLLADLLLDQRIAAGIGNVYKSEVLFLERQHPRRRFSELTALELRRLYGRASGLLRRNLGGGPRITRFVADGRGELWVYGRADRGCLRCGATVRLDLLGAKPRPTYWCPRCQRKGRADRAL